MANTSTTFHFRNEEHVGGEVMWFEQPEGGFLSVRLNNQEGGPGGNEVNIHYDIDRAEEIGHLLRNLGTEILEGAYERKAGNA